MKKLFLPIAIALISLSSCNDDRINEETAFEPMDEFYNEHKPQEQEFIITSDSGGPIVGNQGSRIYGHRHILQHANGDSVYLPYTVKLIELYSYKDMILYNFPTTSSDYVMTSGGHLKIRAIKDGEELVVRPGAYYGVVMSSSYTGPKSVYTGTHTLDVFDDWSLAGNGSLVVDSSGYNALGLTTLGWQSADAAMSATSYTDITFTIEGTGGENIDIFIVHNDFHGLIQGENLQAKNVMVGENVTILAMAMDQHGDFRVHKSTVTVTQNMEIALNMSVSSESSLLSMLGSL